jgi:very-short-patch-repair endonuclease
MTKKEIIEYLKEKSKLKVPKPNLFNVEVKQFLYDYCSETDELKILFYMWKNNINEIPTCQYPNCNNKVKFDISRNKFNKGCCREHSIKSANLKKYGVEFPLQSKIILNKTKDTLKERYGVENPMKVEIFKEKLKNNNFQKYGTSYPIQLNKFKEKQKQTNLQKYGVEYLAQSSKIKNKIKQTNLKKFGVEWNLHSKETKEKHKQKIYQKTFQKKVDILNKINLKLLSTIDEYNGVNKKYKMQCLVCGTIFEDHFDNGRIPYCPKCCPKNKSLIEIDLFENIKYPNKIQSDRKILEGKELDIIIPDKRIAIEMNGIYWHSESNGKDKNYHLNKTELAEKKGYQLLHFWDIEYQNKRDIVLSIIHSKLGIYDRRIYARKCEVREINTSTKDEFLEQNHLQGKDNSKVKLGLFYNNELMSVMTFDKSHYNKKYEWELLRFANKLNYQIIGGASKLFKYFIKNYNSKNYNSKTIIAYADRRYSNGNLYNKLGFKFDGYTKPNYYYIKDETIYSRQQFQKDKLNFFNENLTEWKNMQLNKYDRIWDCGKYRFILLNN